MPSATRRLHSSSRSSTCSVRPSGTARLARLGCEFKAKGQGLKCRVSGKAERTQEERLLGYFVTGATGFIRRHLVERLLEREGTIYVLVRGGSKGELEELRSHWGVDSGRVVAIVGDLSQPLLGISDSDLGRLHGEVDHLFHLAAIYDMTADARTRRVADIEGTRHMVEFANAVGAGKVHMVSSIAAAGLYKGLWLEDMFDEAQDLDTHPYFRTKHDSEGIVRTDYERPWRVYRPGSRSATPRRSEMDKVDGPYYFFKLIQRLQAIVPPWMPTIGIEGKEINIVPVDFIAAALDHIAPGEDERWDGKAFSLTDPNPSAGRVINIFARAGPRRRWGCGWTRRCSRSSAAGALGNADAAAGEADPQHGPYRPGDPGIGADLHQLPHQLRQPQRGRGAGGRHHGYALEAYADKLWDYWERNLDPDLFKDRSLAGAVADKIVMITGASSGSGSRPRSRSAGRGHRAPRRARPRSSRRPAPRSRRRAEPRTYTSATCPTSPTSSGWPKRRWPATERVDIPW